MLTLFAKFAPLLAAEAAAAGGRPIPDWAKGNTIFETFFKGGPVMYPQRRDVGTCVLEPVLTEAAHD